MLASLRLWSLRVAYGLQRRLVIVKGPKTDRRGGVITECHHADYQATAGKLGLYPLAYDHGNPCFCWHRNIETAFNMWACRAELIMWAWVAQWKRFGLSPWGCHPHVSPFLKSARKGEKKSCHWPTDLGNKTSSGRGFAFISFKTCLFQRMYLIACSTHQVTEAFATSFIQGVMAGV